jgi:hypothetical protein
MIAPLLWQAKAAASRSSRLRGQEARLPPVASGGDILTALKAFNVAQISSGVSAARARGRKAP